MFELFIFAVIASVLASVFYAPRPPLLNAEQALARFQAARHTEMKAAMTPQHHAYLTAASSGKALSVKPMVPGFYQRPFWQDAVGDEAKRRLFGNLESLVGARNNLWQITYGNSPVGGLVAYMDARNGQILYVHST